RNTSSCCELCLLEQHGQVQHACTLVARSNTSMRFTAHRSVSPTSVSPTAMYMAASILSPVSWSSLYVSGLSDIGVSCRSRLRPASTLLFQRRYCFNYIVEQCGQDCGRYFSLARLLLGATSYALCVPGHCLA